MLIRLHAYGGTFLGAGPAEPYINDAWLAVDPVQRQRMIGLIILGTRGFMKHPDSLLDVDEVHIHLMRSSLQLEDRRLAPLVENQIAGIEEAGHPYYDQKHRDGQDQKEGETALQAGRPDGHSKPFTEQ
jgi:hypothetical protein